MPVRVSTLQPLNGVASECAKRLMETVHCGVDEAGVGALMGDLVAAAVILPAPFDTTGLCDSKRSRAPRGGPRCAGKSRPSARGGSAG